MTLLIKTMIRFPHLIVSRSPPRAASREKTPLMLFNQPSVYGYLTQESVLSALGVPVNYSEHSAAVSFKFQETYDIVHGGFLESIAYLLDSGVKVTI